VLGLVVVKHGQMGSMGSCTLTDTIASFIWTNSYVGTLKVQLLTW
jgi:hypothetical protein